MFKELSWIFYCSGESSVTIISIAELAAAVLTACSIWYWSAAAAASARSRASLASSITAQLACEPASHLIDPGLQIWPASLDCNKPNSLAWEFVGTLDSCEVVDTVSGLNIMFCLNWSGLARFFSSFELERNIFSVLSNTNQGYRPLRRTKPLRRTNDSINLVYVKFTWTCS